MYCNDIKWFESKCELSVEGKFIKVSCLVTIIRHRYKLKTITCKNCKICPHIFKKSNTCSHPITEVKHHWAGILGWGTTWELLTDGLDLLYKFYEFTDIALQVIKCKHIKMKIIFLENKIFWLEEVLDCFREGNFVLFPIKVNIYTFGNLSIFL